MIGIDIVHIPTFEKELVKGGDIFKRKAFFPEEFETERSAHLAGIFAAKEAVTKACGLPPGSWLLIKIINDETSRPHASVEGFEVEISISHHQDYAAAVAVRRGV